MSSEENIINLSIWMLGTGAIVLLLVVGLGVVIYGYRRRWRYDVEHFEHVIYRIYELLEKNPNQAAQLLPIANQAYSENLKKRNEFWRSYGQIMLAILLLVFITILLLTKTIDPDAGLPILSGIAGFAIAKGSDSGGGMPSPPPGNLG